MYTYYMKSLVMVIFTGLLTSLNGFAETELSLIPKPLKLVQGEGYFQLTSAATISTDDASKRSAELLQAALVGPTGYKFPIKRSSNAAISLRVDSSLSALGEEGYKLNVTASGIQISAPKKVGVFYGVQTLLQLLPTAVYGSDKSSAPWKIPHVKIQDKPRFSYRSMMLDTSRYFHDTEFVKRFLDMMAMHKMNVFHWHLIDDAGWRLEIKKYPKLTTIGAYRGKGSERRGGFYTQDQIREIVKYGEDRNITIIPEIELPAHTLAAVVAYPYLCCLGKEGLRIKEVPTRHYISRDLYCAGKDTTWEFLEDIMTEVCELFPGKFIHIGGDEAKFDRWRKCPHCQAKIKELGLDKLAKNSKRKPEAALQGWMTRRIETFLQAKGKEIIGWDEILGCGISTQAGVMSWHRPQTAGEAAKRGNPVVLALTEHCYFDVAESKLPGEVRGATWIKPISLQKAYQWDPMPKGLSLEAQKNVLGVNGCMWSDQLQGNFFLSDKDSPQYRKGGNAKLSSERYIEYFCLPRMAAIAESSWLPFEMNDWPDFQSRMKAQYQRYTKAGLNYRLPLPLVTISASTITVESPAKGTVVHYTMDGSKPTLTSTIYKKAISSDSPGDFQAMTAASDGTHVSLVYGGKSGTPQKLKKYGETIGSWKAGKISTNKLANYKFEATKVIRGNGEYEVTFVYTSGKHGLNISGVELSKNGREVVAKDLHTGFTGGRSKNNTYRLKLTEYETGAAFTINVKYAGSAGSDSNGFVLMKKVK